jgi:hypothetical protein
MPGARFGARPKRADMPNSERSWVDRYAVDGMFIRQMLLRERNEVTDECMRDR